MIIDKASVKRILIITLSNVGDVILTTPAVAALAKEYPEARIDVMVGPRGKEVFEKDPRIFKLIIYDKHIPISAKRRLQLKLKKLRYDIVVDLRNTVFGLLIGPRYRTSTIQRSLSGVVHSIDRHLHRLRSIGIVEPARRPYIYMPEEDDAYISGLLEGEGLSKRFVVINPGAKSHLKRWKPEGFAALADRLVDECGVDIVFVGTGEDEEVISEVAGKMKERYRNLVNRTNLRQLACLLKRSSLIITNDSAPMHLGCAVGAKVLAIFGPTDPRRYGPTGEFDVVITKKLHCSPCESAKCIYNYECMKLVDPEEVFDAAKMMLEGYE